MRHNPLTRKQLYEKLLPLKPLFEQFKETREVRITDANVELMQEVYPSVQVLGSGSMPLDINGGCPSCIQEAFHVFISVFDRLARDPHVTEETPATDGIGKADGVLDPVQAAKDAANNQGITELSEADEDALLETLGIDRTATPQEYSTRLNAFIEGLDNASPALLSKQAKLTQVVATLPPAPVATPESTNTVPSGNPAPDTRTPAQKTADTKAANKAKKEAEGK